MPKTILVHTNLDLTELLDGKVPSGFSDFAKHICEAIEKVGLPAFMRTGFISNKHDWEKSCFITDTKGIGHHISNLVEQSALCEMDRMTPIDFWAIREFIKTEKHFNYFDGNMPITKEMRYFVNNGKITCSHFYWPKDIFKDVPKEKIEALQAISDDDKKQTDKMAVYVSKMFSGAWSVDFLKSEKGDWLLTDMAIAEKSFHIKHKED